MAANDHWVDEGYKKNSIFAQKAGDARTRNTQMRMQAQQAATSTSMPTKSTTQMRLAALPVQYHAPQNIPQQETQRQYLPQQLGSSAGLPSIDPNAAQPQHGGYGAQQPNYSHQLSQPNYSQQNSQPDYSQQNSQPNYFQQNNQPNYAQQSTQPHQYAQPNSQQSTLPHQYAQPNSQQSTQPHQYAQPNSQQFSQPNYTHPADSQQYSQPNYSQPSDAQEFARANYARQMLQPDHGSDIGYAFPPQASAVREMTDEEIDERAIYDSQTRAFNLRHIVRLLRHEYMRATFTNRALSIFVVAMDNFATIPPGALEKAVDAFARTLITSGRPIDMVGRYTEGRFMILCPEMPAPQASEVAENIRKICEAIVVAHQWQNVKLTASVGVASTAPGIDDLESLIALADLGADMVAEQGGNGVFVAPADSLA